MSERQHPTKILQQQIEPAYTTAPLVVPGHLVVREKQEFLRLPKTGQRDPIYMLSRSSWNLLILPCTANKFRPPIRSISVRQPGTKRGVRLISLISARAYFQRLMDEAEANDATEG